MDATAQVSAQDTAGSTAPGAIDNAAPPARMALTKDEILAAADGRRYEDVPVHEWKPGGVVRVSSLSSEMRDLLENELVRQQALGGTSNLRAFYVWLCAVDDAGDRLFDNIDQIAVLGRKSAKPIDRIFTVTLRLNDLGEKAVETEAKNSAREGSDISS